MSRWQVLARLAGVAVLISVYWWGPLALRPLSFFGVRRVDVAGARYLAPGAVVQAMALRSEASVFDDLGQIERRLAGLGGIASVSVTRQLPATLRVEITEVEPVALAAGPDGLVPLARDARPLPYDVVTAPVDAPIVARAEPRWMGALSQVQATDLGLFADVAAARASGGEVVLDMTRGRVRLEMPVDPEIVRAVSAVRRDLEQRHVAWRELDGRFRGWVVVRKEDAQARRRADAQVETRRRADGQARRPAPARASAQPRRRAEGAPGSDCASARLRVCASTVA